MSAAAQKDALLALERIQSFLSFLRCAGASYSYPTEGAQADCEVVRSAISNEPAAAPHLERRPPAPAMSALEIEARAAIYFREWARAVVRYAESGHGSYAGGAAGAEKPTKLAYDIGWVVFHQDGLPRSDRFSLVTHGHLRVEYDPELTEKERLSMIEMEVQKSVGKVVERVLADAEGQAAPATYVLSCEQPLYDSLLVQWPGGRATFLAARGIR